MGSFAFFSFFVEKPLWKRITPVENPGAEFKLGRKKPAPLCEKSLFFGYGFLAAKGLNIPLPI